MNHTKMKDMTTQEAADCVGITKYAVARWCKKNGIKRKLGKNGIMEYDLSKKDIETLKKRKPKGRPKTDSK